MKQLLLFIALLWPCLAAADDVIELRGNGGKAFIFNVELARTEQEQRHGLMFRTHMAADHGMLFDFGSEQPISMWMKNTYMPLDMFFIGEDGRIHNIVSDTTPESLTPINSDGEVRYVLEVNAGTAARTGIVAGDYMILKQQN